MSNTMGVGREKGTFKEIDIDGKLYRYCDGDEYDWNIVQAAGYFEPMVNDKQTY